MTGATTASTLAGIAAGALTAAFLRRTWTSGTYVSSGNRRLPTYRAFPPLRGLAGAYQPKLSSCPPSHPKDAAIAAATDRRITRRNFHSSIVPPGDFVEGRQTQELWLRLRCAVITRRGYLPEIPRMGYLVRWIPPVPG